VVLVDVPEGKPLAQYEVKRHPFVAGRKAVWGKASVRTAGLQLEVKDPIVLAGEGDASVEENYWGVARVGIIEGKLYVSEEGLGVWLTDLWGQELRGLSFGAWGVGV
jgi:hypothetical protein